jgi:hypothetical protein
LCVHVETCEEVKRFHGRIFSGYGPAEYNLRLRDCSGFMGVGQ